MPHPVKFASVEESRKKFGSATRSRSKNRTRSTKGTTLPADSTISPPFPGAAGIATPNAGLPAARLSRVLAFIDAHLDRNISLAELALQTKLSVYYFATQFKKSTGFSPHRYILHRRVTRARDLLRSTSLRVQDVSLDLGFQHQNNFARAFRRITGMTPSRFRDDNHAVK